MWSPRTQNDRNLFAQTWREMLEATPNLDFWQDGVVGLLTEQGRCVGVKTQLGMEVRAKAVVLTNGTFLNGLMHIGEKQQWEKFTLFEESTRVPLMIVAPGVTRPGGLCKRPVNLLDLYPTLNELCGLERRDDLDGRSLVPLLRDPGAAWEPPSITTWGRNNHSARGQRYRYIRHPDGTEQLYDHQGDSDEFHNIAEKPGVEKIKARLAKWLPSQNAPPVSNNK